VSTQWKFLIKKMAEIANVNYDDLILFEPNWFDQVCWSEEQKNKFRSWFINELKTNRFLKEFIFGDNVLKTDSQIEEAVDIWIKSFGWTTRKHVRDKWWDKYNRRIK